MTNTHDGETRTPEQIAELFAIAGREIEAIEQLTGWYDDVKRLETERLASLLALGSKVTKFLEAKDKIVSLARPRGAKKDG